MAAHFTHTPCPNTPTTIKKNQENKNSVFDDCRTQTAYNKESIIREEVNSEKPHCQKTARTTTIATTPTIAISTGMPNSNKRLFLSAFAKFILFI